MKKWLLRCVLILAIIVFAVIIYRPLFIEVTKTAEEKWMERAEGKDPQWEIEWVFERYNDFKDQSYAERVLETAMKNDPLSAMVKFCYYKSAPFAKQIFIEAAKIQTIERKNPETVLIEADRIVADEPWVKNLIYVNVVALDHLEPEKMFQYYPIYRDEPYAEEFVKDAAKKAPTAAIRYIKYFDTSYCYYGGEIIRIAVKNLPQKDIGILLENSRKIKDILGKNDPIVQKIIAIENAIKSLKK